MALTMQPGLLGSGKMTLTQADSTVGHGAVSQYETLNLSKKSSKFSPLDYLSDKEEDLIPQYHPPSPVKPTSSQTLLASDPALCVTPEHPRSKAPFRPLGAKGEETLTTKKVRFMVDCRVVGQGSPSSEGEGDPVASFEPVKSFDSWSADDSQQEYDPSFYSDPGDVDMEANCPRTLSYRVGDALVEDGEDTDLSSTGVKEVKTSNSLNRMHRLDGGMWKPYTSMTQSLAKAAEKTQQKKATKPIKIKTSEVKVGTKQLSKRQADRKADANLAEDSPVLAAPPVPVMAEGPPYTVGQKDKGRPPVMVVREVPTQPRLPDYSFPFSQPADLEPVEGGPEWEHVLARPEYHSTLRQVAEINAAKAARPDVQDSVEKILQQEEIRTEINEKAASKVNRMGELFSGLTLVDLPEEHICQQLEQEQILRAPVPRQPPSSSTRVRGHREPDLMEFFSERFVRDTADFSLNIPAPSESLSTADPYLAFDLYRHCRSWED